MPNPTNLFVIPDRATVAFDVQAQPDQEDFRALALAGYGTGVMSGCAVTAQGTPNMTVAVAAGIIRVAGVFVSVAAGNVTITAAHATLERQDLVVVNSAGTKSVVAGTPAAAGSSVFPAIPADSVVLAGITIPAADTAINANQIVAKGVGVPPSMETLFTTFIHTGLAVVQDGIIPVTAEYPLTITKVRVRTPQAGVPTGAGMRFDLRKNGSTTVFSAKPTIAAAANPSTVVTTSIAAAGVLAIGDFLTAHVETIGTTYAGSDWIMTVYGQRSA